MNRETSNLLERLAEEKDSLVVRRLCRLLESSQSRVEPRSGQTVSAGELAPTYRVRYQIAKDRGTLKHFLGLSSLVSALQESSPSRKIVIRSVIGESELGHIFFDKNTHEVIGAVVITMSAHTRAFYRNELTGDPTGATPGKIKPVMETLPRQAVNVKKVMA